MRGTVLTFYIGNNLFGIDILAVKEINRNIEYTAVPGAPPHIIGLLNMRGQIVTLFNLAYLMGYGGEAGKDALTCVILKNRPDNPDYAGFLIDRPGSSVEVAEEICEPPPANTGNVENKFISEVVKLEGELLMIIDRQALFEN